MKLKKAQELREAWGSKPCDHPAFAKLYDMGERTGGFACTQCGASFTSREKADLVADRRA
jgi:hypothetical protein